MGVIHIIQLTRQGEGSSNAGHTFSPCGLRDSNTGTPKWKGLPIIHKPHLSLHYDMHVLYNISKSLKQIKYS